MYFKPLLIPLLAQVALTFIVMIVMYRKRVNEMKSKRIHPQRVKRRSDTHGILPDSESAANNYANGRSALAGTNPLDDWANRWADFN